MFCKTKRLLDFCFLLYLNILFSGVDLQRLTPLLRNICVWIWERSWRRHRWGGGMLRVWVHDRASHYQQHRSSWDLIIHCSHCLHHNNPQLVARWGFPVLECVHVWMGRGQQNQRISTVERKLKKREQKTKGLVYWFKHWLIDLQVTANVKGPSHRTSLPPSQPPTQPSSLCCSACLCQCSQKNLSPFPSLFCSVSFPTITPLSCPLHPFSWNSWFHHRTGLISPTL